MKNNLELSICIWKEPITKEVENHWKEIGDITRLKLRKCLICSGYETTRFCYVAKRDVKRYMEN